MRLPAPPRAARGVTLLEMLLVIALIAVAGLLAAGAVTGGLDGMRLRSAGKQIAAQLRFTRTQALASGQPQRFSLDPVARRWQAPSGHQGEIPPGLEIRFTGARQVQRHAREGAIVFFPEGGATGGRIELQARKATWRIDVSWVTGEVVAGPLRGTDE
ncbi:type II secretion system protein XpsH [[Pseudomonas] boreopolis]|uniref:type II secretion system protein XpsH n=1 Tax=Xanthomonas boreopolis TaxID=86183 RepID=UPI003D453A5B